MTSLRKPVKRVSNSMASSYGPDGRKRLVISIIPGPDGRDMIELRPERTQRPKTALLTDVYRWIIKCEADGARMAKLREKKLLKAERRANRKWAAELRKANKEGV